MDYVRSRSAEAREPPAGQEPVPLFWVAMLVFALASALAFLALSLRERAVGWPTVSYCALAALFSLVIGLALCSVAGRARLRQLTSKLVFLGVSSAFCLLVLELAVRLLSPPAPFHAALALRPQYRAGLNVNLPGVSPAGVLSTNRWGLRGDEPPAAWDDHYTIVTIGGSTTQCFFLDDKKTWPALLQQKLRVRHPQVWVGNGGLDGHSTRGHLLFMREAIAKMKPDAAILLVGINDFSLSLNEHARLRGNGYDLDAGLNITRPTDAVRRLQRTLRHHSRLLQLAFVWKEVLLKEVVVVDRRGQGGDDITPLREPAPSLPEDLQSVLPQLGEFRKNVRQIIEVGKAHGVRLVFLTQPHRFQDDEFYRGQLPSYYWLNMHETRPEERPPWSAAQHWLLLAEYNRTLIEICREEQVECFDLGAAIPHGGECFYDLVHFNEAGAERVAAEVAAFLESSPVTLEE